VLTSVNGLENRSSKKEYTSFSVKVLGMVTWLNRHPEMIHFTWNKTKI